MKVLHLIYVLDILRTQMLILHCVLVGQGSKIIVLHYVFESRKLETLICHWFSSEN